MHRYTELHWLQSPCPFVSYHTCWQGSFLTSTYAVINAILIKNKLFTSTYHIAHFHKICQNWLAWIFKLLQKKNTKNNTPNKKKKTKNIHTYRERERYTKKNQFCLQFRITIDGVLLVSANVSPRDLFKARLINQIHVCIRISGCIIISFIFYDPRSNRSGSYCLRTGPYTLSLRQTWLYARYVVELTLCAY